MQNTTIPQHTRAARAVLALLPCVLLGAACTVYTSPNGQTTVSPGKTGGSNGSGGQGTAVPAGSGTASAGGGAAGGTMPASADCPNPENHCLADDVVIAAANAYEKGYVYAFPARQMGAPNPGGEATYLNLQTGQQVTTQHVFPSHRARPEELQVGRLAVMFYRSEGGMYHPPRTREEAQGTRWWLSRIVSVANVDQGFVLVANGYQIATSNIRILNDPSAPTATVSPTVDEHFLSTDHWIVSNRGGLPESGYIYASVAAPAQLPSPETQGQGHFIRTSDGAVVWTEHAWRTRKATKEDLRPGMNVVIFYQKRGGTYVGPESRAKALGSRWWITQITDTSTLFRNTVSLAGGYTADVSALRVILPR